MTDSAGREINYMRISVTDRCNLRCQYCMPNALPPLSHGDILRYEEILRVCSAAAELGIRHFRVTGGEPFVRKGLLDFLSRLKQIPGAETISITTNGTQLEPAIDALARIGINGVNISLDTLNRDVYRRLTGQDSLDTVLRSLEKSVAAGLKTKINCVPLRGVNDGELADLADLSRKLPVDVRFIELMPTKAGQGFLPIAGEQIRRTLRQHYPDLRPAADRRGCGPAVYYQSDHLLGRLGFIDAITGHFCGGCNRVRLTSSGFFKLCLYHDHGVSLRNALRSGIDDDGLRRIMLQNIHNKPDGHHFGDVEADGGINQMSGIGG